MDSKEILRRILEAMIEGPVSPSDVVTRTRLPRYMVLASFHILEALGYVELLYSRGTYKVYVLSSKGRELLEELGVTERTPPRVESEEEAAGELAA